MGDPFNVKMVLDVGDDLGSFFAVAAAGAVGTADEGWRKISESVQCLIKIREAFPFFGGKTSKDI